MLNPEYLQSWLNPEQYTALGTLGLTLGFYFFYTRAFVPLKEKYHFMRHGVHFPGWHIPFIGDAQMLGHVEANPDKDGFCDYIQQLYKDKETGIPSVTGVSFQNFVWVLVNDCELYKELVIDNAKNMDRGESFQYFLDQIFPGSIIALKTNEIWKEKRKVVAGAFFKEKMNIASTYIKKIALEKIALWQEKGDVDIALEFKLLQGDIIMAFTCGLENLDRHVKYEEPSGKIVDIKIFDSMSKQIGELNAAAFGPIKLLLPELNNFQLSGEDRRISRNIERLRDGIRDIIAMNKKKFTMEELKKQGNLMSVCLTDDLYANEPDHIVNEILLFFLAGALTMSLSSANMVIFMNQSRNAHYKKQLLDEIDTVFKPKKDLLNEFTNDDLDDLIFLKQCYNETLRMDTPVGVVTPYKVTKPFTARGIPFRPGCSEIVFMTGIFCKDKKQWKNPEEFRPERFDSSNKEYFMKPDGTPRAPYAFSSFHAGSRVCFGKTFAEMTVRLTLPMIFHLCDFEFIDKSLNEVKPQNNTILLKEASFKVKVSKRNL